MPNFGVNDNDRRTAEAMERIWAAQRKEQVMSEVLPTEEMLMAQRLMADMPDQIQNFFNSDVRKLFATIDHWRQRAEQAEKECRIRDLAVPLEEDMSQRIDEMMGNLAQEQYTTVAIARLLRDVQKRIAADWIEIGHLRPLASRAEQAEADRDAARKLCEDDMTWMHDERCSACGHRLRFSASHCPQCRAPGVPDWKLPKELPDICECERCVDARSALGRAK